MATKALKNQAFKTNDQEIEKFYIEHLDDFSTIEKFKVEQVTINSKSAAQFLMKMMQNTSFDQAIEQWNKGKSAKATKTSLGFIGKNDFKPIGQLASTLNVGDISEPLALDSGFVMITVTEKSDPIHKEFEQIKTLIISRLVNEKREQNFSRILNDLKNNNIIQIYQKNLKTGLTESEF